MGPGVSNEMLPNEIFLSSSSRRHRPWGPVETLGCLNPPPPLILALPACPTPQVRAQELGRLIAQWLALQEAVSALMDSTLTDNKVGGRGRSRAGQASVWGGPLAARLPAQL